MGVKPHAIEGEKTMYKGGKIPELKTSISGNENFEFRKGGKKLYRGGKNQGENLDQLQEDLS
jgi:hypothetical protein